MSLNHDEYQPLEDKDGKFVEVMGVTASDAVLIYSGGKTLSVALETLPKEALSAGTKLYLKEDGTVKEVTKPLKAAATKSTANRQSPLHMPIDPYA